MKSTGKDSEPPNTKSFTSKLTKPKRPNILIKKFKLKSNKSNISASTSHIPTAENPQVIVQSNTELPTRETPEGDDNFMLARSSSEKSLKEGGEQSCESAEICSGKTPDTEQDNQNKILDSQSETTTHRVCAKSLDNLKNMPAYGDLTMDIASNAKQVVSKPVDHLYKILVIGDVGSGKTSIIKRYVHKFFTQNYRATIGVDFALKVLNWDENTLIRLQLWDIGGQERFSSMTRVYYKDAVGAFIVFDVTRVHTFETVDKWKADLDSKVQLSNDSPVPCVLLANKCDLPKEGLVNNANKMDEYCKEKGFIAWFETSAKDNINVDEAAKALIQNILDNDALINHDNNKDDDKFSLNKCSDAQKNGRKKCSC